MRLTVDGWISDNLVRFVGSPGGMDASGRLVRMRSARLPARKVDTSKKPRGGRVDFRKMGYSLCDSAWGMVFCVTGRILFGCGCMSTTSYHA